MGSDSLALEGVKGRQRTDDLIETDREAALRAARGIRHPWYRCQALAAASASAGWRTEQIVAFASENLAESDPEAALALLASRTPNRFSRQAYARLRAAGILPETQ
jgi:hypothetical protein